jgi:hypothetical protein
MREISLTLICLILFIGFTIGQVPKVINYQGRLTDDTGETVADGEYPIQFKIWNDPLAGSTKWTSQPETVLVINGLFNYQLGSNETIPSWTFNDTNLWLAITLGYGPSAEDIWPRVRLVSVPFAFEALSALYADTSVYSLASRDSGDITIVDAGLGLTGGGTTGDVTLDVGVGDGLGVDADQVYIADNGITSNKILDGAIIASDIDNTSVQQRITGTAAPGNYITGVNADGSVVTAADQTGGGNGWVDDGSMIRLETTSDYVGIGVSNPGEKLEVDGTVKMQGIIIPNGAASGRVLTSNSQGEGSWQVNANGDITAALAGDGLTGGGYSGDVTLDVVFAGNGTALQAARADHNHDPFYVNEGQSNSITSDMIYNGTIQFGDINQNGATTGQVMKWDIGSWTAADDETGGWEDDGNEIILANINDSVGIGTTNPFRKLHVVGDAYIDGELTWSAKTNYRAIPAAAFQSTGNNDYSNNGNYAYSNGGDLIAPVYLPDGAYVTRVTFYWEDGNTTEDGRLTFYQSYMNGAGVGIGTIYTNGSAGTSDSSYITSISGGAIKNTTDAYFLRFHNYTDIELHGVKIEYTFTEPY